MSSVSVSVENPRKLTRETAILVGGGAMAGLVTSGLNLIAGEPVAALGALAFGGVVGLLVNLTDPRAGTPMLRLVLAILGGVTMALLLGLHWAPAAVVGGVLLGLALSLDDGDTRVERAFIVGMYGLALAGATFVTQTLAPLFDSALAASVFSGSTWGVFLAFAGGLKRLKWSRDEVIAEFDEALAELRGDERATLRSGRVLYEQIVRELDRTTDAGMRARAMEIADETSRALVAITRRADELRVAAERTSSRPLQQRIVDLDARIRDARDATVRRELEATLDELVQQVKVRRRFEVARARLEARQQRCFTALERLHVSLVQSSSGADDVAVRESIDSLERLTDEVRWRNLSVDELVEDGAPDGDDVVDSEDVVAEIRAELDAAADDEVVEPEAETVLHGAETGASLAEEPGGTDGHVEVESASEVATSRH